MGFPVDVSLIDRLIGQAQQQQQSSRLRIANAEDVLATAKADLAASTGAADVLAELKQQIAAAERRQAEAAEVAPSPPARRPRARKAK